MRKAISMWQWAWPGCIQNESGLSTCRIGRVAFNFCYSSSWHIDEGWSQDSFSVNTNIPPGKELHGTGILLRKLWPHCKCPRFLQPWCDFHSSNWQMDETRHCILAEVEFEKNLVLMWIIICYCVFSRLGIACL